jgi:hypothetical protein
LRAYNTLLFKSAAAPFLVSTTRYLLAVDADTGLVAHVHSGKGLYFGLTESPDGLVYVACRNATEGPENESVRAAERGTILVLNRDLEIVGELHAPFPLRDVHGIACFDNRLWVTCSFDNLVAIYDLSTRQWSQWYPAPNPAERGRDVHHFNTLRFEHNKLCLVAHCFGPSQLWFYDYPSLQLQSVLPLGNMAHDVIQFKGAIATCSSAEGCIVNACGQKLSTGGFPRGVGLTVAGNLVGISLHAPRAERSDKDAVLKWYSPDWHFRADYELPGAGMVLDILPLKGKAQLLKLGGNEDMAEAVIDENRVSMSR